MPLNGDYINQGQLIHTMNYYAVFEINELKFHASNTSLHLKTTAFNKNHQLPKDTV